MALIDNNRPAKTYRPPEPKPEVKKAKTEPAKTKTEASKAKETPTQAKQKADSFVSDKSLKNFTSSAQKDIKSFAKNLKAAVTTNKDGSVTRSLEKTGGKTTRNQELTTSKGLLGDSKVKYTNTSKTDNSETKNTYNAQRDVFGRTQSTHQRESTVEKGDTKTTRSSTQAKDVFGNQKTTRGQTKTVKDGDNSQTTSKSTTTDNRGNKLKSESSSSTVKNDKTTTTRSSSSSSGTERSTTSTATYADGKFKLGGSVDTKTQSYNKQSTYSKETEVKKSSADKGFEQKTKGSKLDYAQKGGDMLAGAGAQKTLAEGKFDHSVSSKNLVKDPNSFVGARAGVSGNGKVTLGTDGLTATGHAEAKAGVYAETHGGVDGKYGSASYSAQAKAEAKASADGSAKINANGVDAEAHLKAGVSVEASATGHAETKSVKVAGVDVKASADGTVRASAEAEAHADGKVKVTRNPPTAVAEGSVGASAVAKVEGNVTASAGPFSVHASAYASAGAEAKASGTIGYEDGKIKIGGSLGAAIGLGAGGSAEVDIDVKQLGQMAKNEIKSIPGAQTAINTAKTVEHAVVDTAKNVEHKVADTAKNVEHKVADTVHHAASSVKHFFGF